MELVNCKGKDHVGVLSPVFEKFLTKAPKGASYDSVRQAVVVLMGSLAKHLDPTQPKVSYEKIVNCISILIEVFKKFPF